MTDRPEHERTGRTSPDQTLKPEFPAKERGDSSANIRQLAAPDIEKMSIDGNTRGRFPSSRARG